MSRESFEELHEPTHSSWSLWIIVCILIAFGTFWFLSERSIRSQPLPSTSIAPTASLDALQASVIESEIPDYSAGF